MTPAEKARRRSVRLHWIDGGLLLIALAALLTGFLALGLLLLNP